MHARAASYFWATVAGIVLILLAIAWLLFLADAADTAREQREYSRFLESDAKAREEWRKHREEEGHVD